MLSYTKYIIKLICLDLQAGGVKIKKQVLLKKLQAVRQGGGENIMASYEPSNWRADKNMRINKLMDR